jgi:hypothetical protein
MSRVAAEDLLQLLLVHPRAALDAAPSPRSEDVFPATRTAVRQMVENRSGRV